MNIIKVVFGLLLCVTNTLCAGELSPSNQYKMCTLLSNIVEVAANLRDLGLDQDTTIKLIRSKNTIEDIDVKGSIDYAIDSLVPQVYDNKEASADLLKMVALRGCLK